MTVDEARAILAKAGKETDETHSCDLCEVVTSQAGMADLGGDRMYGGVLTAFPSVCLVCHHRHYDGDLKDLINETEL